MPADVSSALVIGDFQEPNDAMVVIVLSGDAKKRITAPRCLALVLSHAFNAFPAASIVRSMSVSVCAVEMNAASNCEGGI